MTICASICTMCMRKLHVQSCLQHHMFCQLPSEQNSGHNSLQLCINTQETKLVNVAFALCTALTVHEGVTNIWDGLLVTDCGFHLCSPLIVQACVRACVTWYSGAYLLLGTPSGCANSRRLLLMSTKSSTAFQSTPIEQQLCRVDGGFRI